MTQAKRSRTKLNLNLPDTPTPPFYITAGQLAGLGLTSDDALQRMADANLLYAAIESLGSSPSGAPFQSTRDALTQWALAMWPDLSLDAATARMNDALTLLQRMSLVTQVG